MVLHASLLKSFTSNCTREDSNPCLQSCVRAISTSELMVRSGCCGRRKTEAET